MVHFKYVTILSVNLYLKKGGKKNLIKSKKEKLRKSLGAALEGDVHGFKWKAARSWPRE